MLTQRQKDLAEFIQARTRQMGYCPSYQEMSDGIGVAKGGIQRLLDGLEERGFIRRLRGKRRAVEVIKTPAHKRVAAFRFDDETKAFVPLEQQTDLEDAIKEKSQEKPSCTQH